MRIGTPINVGGVRGGTGTILDMRSAQTLLNAKSKLVRTKINRSHSEREYYNSFFIMMEKGIGLDKAKLIRNTSQTFGKLPTMLRGASGTGNLDTQLHFF